MGSVLVEGQEGLRPVFRFPAGQGVPLSQMQIHLNSGLSAFSAENAEEAGQGQVLGHAFPFLLKEGEQASLGSPDTPLALDDQQSWALVGMAPMSCSFRPVQEEPGQTLVWTEEGMHSCRNVESSCFWPNQGEDDNILL